MNVLLFSHKNDIDGMGNVVLAKLAFDKVDYILCETFDLETNVMNTIDTKKIYTYDKIFITDLCLKETSLQRIFEDELLKDKFQIIDHHKTYDHEKYTKYPFVKVQIQNDKGICCATSLFYEYLMEHHLLSQSVVVDEFVELTRQHDTWEWKNIYHNEKARELAILFDALGIEGYISFIYDKCRIQKEFVFNEIEAFLIRNKKLEINDAIAGYLNNIYHRELLGYKAGIIFINYQHRNEIAEYLREHQYPIDFVMLISLDRGVVSYRSTKDHVTVRLIAEYFNGKGHDKAATNPITTLQKELMINILTSGKDE